MNAHTTITSVSLAAVALAGLAWQARADPAQTRSASPERSAWSERSRVVADVDGDGRLDTALQLTRGESGDRSRIKVLWATGGTATVRVPFSGYEQLELGLDLDGDGSQELVLVGSGGEATWWQVVTEEDHRLTRVRTVDANGDPSPLDRGITEGSDAPWNTAWHTDLRADGFWDFRFVDAHPTMPAAIRVSPWTLEGATLTRAARTQQGCYGADGYFGVTLGPC